MTTQNKKKRILVTYIEAGFGHITTANSIADAIEALHDPNIEVIREYILSVASDVPKKQVKSFTR